MVHDEFKGLWRHSGHDRSWRQVCPRVADSGVAAMVLRVRVGDPEVLETMRVCRTMESIMSLLEMLLSV